MTVKLFDILNYEIFWIWDRDILNNIENPVMLCKESSETELLSLQPISQFSVSQTMVLEYLHN